MSFGAYPHISLKDARSRRDDAKELRAKGTDPGEARKAEKAAERAITENTFGALAREWFDTDKDGWTDAYSTRLWRRIEGDLPPKLGERPMNKIEPPGLLAVIRSVEARDARVLAKRLLQVSGQIFRFRLRLDGRHAILARSVDPHVSTRGEMGQLVLTVFGMVAQMERRFIKERQREGIQRAKAEGVYKGGQQRLDRGGMMALHEAGMGVTAIAKAVGCSRMQVYRILQTSAQSGLCSG